MGENKEYKEMIDGFVEYQKNLHAKNQKKISVGLKVNILLPLVFLLLCFFSDGSKLIFLMLWIISLFGIAFYLVYVEFIDYKIVRKMKAVSSENPKEYQLKIIKRQRNISISTGDMFLVQPIDGLFYVGQVIKSNLGEDAIDPFIGGCHLIVIFDQPFSSIDVDTQTVPVDYYRLLIKPCIVDAVYWKRGYFFAKGNRSVPLVDELDYGFWSFRRQSFQNLNGEPSFKCKSDSDQISIQKFFPTCGLMDEYFRWLLL